MVDQKQLREMMKKEKEQRAAARASTARPVSTASQARQATLGQQVAVSPAATPAAVATVATSSNIATPAAPRNSLVGAYGDDDSDEDAVPQEPSVKRARAEDATAMPPPPVPVKTSRSTEADSREQADALLMPPPPVPGVRKSVPAVIVGAPQDEDEPVGPLPLVLAEAAVAIPEDALGRAGSSELARAAESDEGEGEELPQEPELPVGFFDDPELDAKARGVEAPSVVAQRELEEGLKRFEKEMIVEREKAEEARNELEEDRQEEQTAEEIEFQKNLQDRLEALRRKKAEAAARTAVAAATAQSEGTGDTEVEEDSDSDSDVNFDWRAKDFG